MRQGHQKGFRATGLILLQLLFFLPGLFAQPSAEILNNDSAICESGSILLSVRLTGTPDFGLTYGVYDQDGVLVYRDAWIKESEALQYPGDLSQLGVDTYLWERLITPPVSALTTELTIVLLKVFDSSISRDSTITLEPAWKNSMGIDVQSQSFNVRVDRAPTPNAGVDIKLLCGYDASLNAIPQDNSQSHYWRAHPDGTFADVTDPQTTFTRYNEGVSTLWFIEENGVCMDSASVLVELLGLPSATLFPGVANTCTTDGSSTFTMIAVDNFQGTAPFLITISDAITDQELFTLTSPAGGLASQIWGSPEAHKFYISSLVDSNNCVRTDFTDTLEVIDVKPDAYPGESRVACGEETILGASLTDPANTGQWSSADGSVTFDDATNPETRVSVSAYGPKTFIWTETESTMGCTHSNEVILDFTESPTLTIGEDTSFCAGGTAILELEATGNSPWEVTYNDGTNQDVISMPSPTVSHRFPNVNRSTNYTLEKITDQNGCETVLDHSFIVNIDEMPVANAGFYDPVCGLEIRLNAIPSIVSSIGFWRGNGNFTSANTSDAVFAAMQYGEHQLVWTETNSLNGQCSDSDTVVIRLDEEPAEPYAGEDQELLQEFSTTLNADAPTVGVGYWSARDAAILFSETADPNSFVSNLKPGEQSLTWTVVNGACEEKSDELIINVLEMILPTGFSPNGDLVNDFFIIPGAPFISNNELIILDSDGRLVFRTKNFMADGGTTERGWDGIKEDGNVAEDGTYYYIFTGDNINSVENYLIIKRSK